MYFALPKASIGKKTGPSKIRPMANPISLPNRFASSIIKRIWKTKVTGEQHKTAATIITIPHHAGLSQILHNTIKLYTGTMAAQPGSPALVKVIV
jgi:hypothetical protein